MRRLPRACGYPKTKQVDVPSPHRPNSPHWLKACEPPRIVQCKLCPTPLGDPSHGLPRLEEETPLNPLAKCPTTTLPQSHDFCAIASQGPPRVAISDPFGCREAKRQTINSSFEYVNAHFSPPTRAQIGYVLNSLSRTVLTASFPSQQLPTMALQLRTTSRTLRSLKVHGFRSYMLTLSAPG